MIKRIVVVAVTSLIWINYPFQDEIKMPQNPPEFRPFRHRIPSVGSCLGSRINPRCEEKRKRTRTAKVIAKEDKHEHNIYRDFCGILRTSSDPCLYDDEA